MPRPTVVLRTSAFVLAATSILAVPFSSAASPTSTTKVTSSNGAPRDPEGAGTPRRDEPRRWVTITVNPLALAVARFGGNVEVVPLRHHAIVASAYLQAFPGALIGDIVGRNELNSTTPTAFGGELGYRFYTGRDGAHGFFLGPSAVMMPLAYPRYTEVAVSRAIGLRSVDGLATAGSVELVPFYGYGAAFDVGGQLVTSSGFTFGGGLGVTFLAYRIPNDPFAVEIPFATPHVLPRLLLSAGWSF